MDDVELLKKRFSELANKSYNAGIYLFTDFLGLAEQAIFNEVEKEFSHIKYTLFGGADGTERVMVRFGDEENLGYVDDFPILCIKCAPVSQKFADKLTHRDFLGAILNLGIERKNIGDIPIIDNVGYVFVKRDIAEYVKDSLSRVKHTDVRTEIIEQIPEGELYKTERRLVQAVGERVDAIVAKVFHISRDDSLSLFKKGLVFIDGRACENNSKNLKVGETVSVRGYGRLIYRGYASTSKKGKLNIEVDLFV